MRRALLAFVLALCALAAFAQSPAPEVKPLRILFVGNSLTFTGDIPGRLEKLARAMGRKATVESAAYPDYSLEDHWRDGRALTAIKKGWDIVVLQQGPSTQDDSRAQLVDFSKRFAKPIREAGAKPALYMVWPLQQRMGDFRSVITSYRQAAAAVDGIVLPVGEAWLRALSADKRIRLYSDPIHPASLGGDLAVLTLYLSLFPAGQYEFDDAFIAKAANALEIPQERRELLFDAATRAIDEPMSLK
ncbi:MAG: hypothetical protein ABIQ72_09350 [Usitatibacter sp.]